MRLKFFGGMILNGRTEVLNAKTGERLGRTDAFVATNIDLGGSIDNLDAMIGKLREIKGARGQEAAPGTTPQA